MEFLRHNINIIYQSYVCIYTLNIITTVLTQFLIFKETESHKILDTLFVNCNQILQQKNIKI